jgi:hypothetical protein
LGLLKKIGGENKIEEIAAKIAGFINLIQGWLCKICSYKYVN